MTHYEPSIPRAVLGIAAVAMTAITIAVSAILPAQMDPGRREPRVLAASKAAPASIGLATVTSINVVAARESGIITLPMRPGEAESHPRRLAKTTSPAVIRVSSD